MKIYIAGKITGDPHYRDKFSAVGELLEKQGHIVLSPAVLPEGMTQADYMRICFAMIDAADAVCFLPDASKREGALLELQYCDYTFKDALHLDDLCEVDDIAKIWEVLT